MIRICKPVQIALCLVLPLSCRSALAGAPRQAGFEVTSYRLALTPDILNKSVAGREIIELRSTTDNLQRLSFTGNSLMIDSARLDGVTVVVNSHDGVLDFDLPAPLRRGRLIKLELAYHGRPARGFAGSADTLYTSYFACDWMVCRQNEFGDKADFSLDLRVPTGMDTLSVGRLVRIRADPDGSKIHQWRSRRPYSPYLFGFAIGQFARVSHKVGSSKITYLSPLADKSALSARFAMTGDMVRFLSEKAGVPLPVAEYSQLLVEGDEAQEAATYSVLGINALPTRVGEAREDWAIVHELAHQWWGNLITCASQDEFWLNEGITTFMTAAWKEHRYGRAAYDAELDVARNRLERARTQGFDKPLIWPGPYPSLSVRRAIQYSKGALFMAHLRTKLGEDAFWSGLRRYTQVNAGRTVSSIDLQRAMESSSRRDLTALFSEWVFGTVSEAGRHPATAGQ